MFVHRDVVLSNGLPVVLVPQPALHRAVATLYLRIGSRFETLEQNGLSHFLEHMVFRGTATLESAHAQALAFEQIGGTLYAATHVDHGVMTISVPPPNLERVLDLLGEVALTPRFTELEIERGIVREEILEDKDDDGREIDGDNLSRALMYGKHPLGFTITGDLESLERFDEAKLRAHHASHYTTANAVLCLAGRIDDPEACLRVAERSFGAMPVGERATIAAPPGLQKRARFRYVPNTSSQTDLRVAFRAVSETDAREPAVEMLLRVLDDGMSTRLYERVCDRKGLCYDVSGMFEAYEDDGVFDVAAEAQHERAALVVTEILDLCRELAEHGPTEAELTKARQRHLWSTEAMLDDADALAGFYGLSALAQIACTPAGRHAQLAAVRTSDVRDAAEMIFRKERLCGVAVGLLEPAEQVKIERAVRSF